VIDVPKALVIVTGVAGLGDELARRVEANVLPKAAAQTSGELRQAVARAVAAADPAGAQCRHDQAVKAARVERWAEAAGTGALAGRDLPAADALAADNRINALAAALRADGAAGGMDFLRAQVFAGLLLGRPVAAPADAPAPAPAADAPAADAPAPVPAAGTGDIPGLAATDDPVPDQVPAVGPAPDAPAPGGDSATGHGGDLGGATDCGAAAGGAGDSAAGSAAVSGSGYAGGAGLVSGAPARLARVAAGPAPPPGLVGPPGGWGHLTGSVNLTLPLAALLGEGGAPAEVAGFGPVPAAAAAQLAAAAWQSPAMRWCITVTDAAGRAAGHGCATSSPAAAAAARGPGAAVGGGPGGASGGWAFQVTVAALATGDCDHHRETPGYVPPKSLRHLIEIRDQTCSFPGCRRPARQCDLDHSVAYARGGRSCECNLAPLCRLHHKIKQARGWKLEQPEPGVLQWTAPSGWRYTVTPRGHPT
jgi:hypothetical protein